MHLRRPTAAGVAGGLGTGLLLAASIPPWGFWPLGIAGGAALDRLLADQPRGARFRRGVLVGIALLGPTMWWIHDLTLPGYAIAVGFYAVLLGVGTTLCPPGPGRRLALPGLWLLVEAVRSAWPFGGVPLSILASGQVGGPLAPLARLGGAPLLGAATVTAGIGLSALAARQWRPAAVALSAVVLVVGAAAIAPRGEATGRTLSVAYVQGGGPQGTRAIDTNPDDVFRRHLRASERVRPGVDLTVWPEDVVDVDGPIAQAPENQELADLARRKRTYLVAGLVESDGPKFFFNSSNVYSPEGDIIARYEKVQRVPFGEVVPFRKLIERFAPATLPQRDAVKGRKPAVLRTPKATMAVVISWEVFFGHRARDGVRHGGELILNPTNGSTYTGTLVQTQQIAASRLRAIETGRWVVQAAPTGFSAFVTPNGHVISRSAISKPAVREHVVGLRRGFTIYTRWGDRPLQLLAVALVLGGWLVALGGPRGLARADHPLRSRRRRPVPA